MWLDQTRTTINRVRITGDREESQALAMRTERLFATTQLDVRVSSPAAILVVRTLRDPLPGKWRLPRSIEAYAPPLWQQAVTTALDQAARNAARPIDGTVAVTAQAVLFADPAEVLACLAQDWLEGSLVSRWWWQSLLGVALSQGATPALLSAWLKTAHAIPAALHLLAQRQAARPFVQALSGEASAALVTAVAETFGLVAIHWAITDIDPSWQQVTATGSAGQIAPWSSWTPEAASPGLSRPQIALLGIGLGLARAPAVVRSAAFAREIVAWIAATSPSPIVVGNASLPASDRPPQNPEQLLPGQQTFLHLARSVGAIAATSEPMMPSRPSNWVLSVRSASDPPLIYPSVQDADRSAGTEADDPIEPGAESSASYRDEELPEVLIGAGKTALPLEIGLVATSVDQGEPLRALAAPLAAPKSAVVRPLAIAEAPEVVLTGYGGVFYLVNLGLYLGLYGDFSAPLQPGLELSIYDFVALVAAGLCPDERALLADPVWPLLARLAGRGAEDPPGAGFAPPDGSSLAEWLDSLLATVRERLQRALGTSEEDASELCRLLLAQRARVLVTATRLDVFFVLDEHPVRIRLSGLDRDPGWVPAAWRSVAFHYE